MFDQGSEIERAGTLFPKFAGRGVACWRVAITRRGASHPDWRIRLAVEYDNPVVAEAVTTPSTPPNNVAPPERGPASEAVLKFRSCRWRRPAEDTSPECCAHRDVLPLTGTKGFDPEAWCPECTFFKLRRNPRRSF
jgi:hypothetical protein